MNPIKIAKHHLYFLQLENYNLSRYIKVIVSGALLPKREARKKILWTPKLVLVFLIAILLQILTIVVTASFFETTQALTITFLVLVYPLSLLTFLFLSLATIVIYPVDYTLKNILISKAKKKVRGFKNLVIIGITGSYGKTTMKEILTTVLRERFQVLKTPENVNTPVGISRLILEKLTTKTEVLIVEMGAYKKGDIKILCSIAQPNIGILTGINESHLERFGNLKNTISAKFEVIMGTVKNGTVILNVDDKHVADNYEKYVGKRKTLFYTSAQHKDTSYEVRNHKLLEDASGTTFSIFSGHNDLGSFKVPFLGKYAAGMIVGAILVAKELGLEEETIIGGIAKIKPTPHRLNMVSNKGGIVVIDDSYNGNPDGAREAIRVLGILDGKRKIYVTPGLVEMDKKNREVHEDIGKLLAGVANMVILIKNSATDSIAEGLKMQGFPESDIMWFDTPLKAYNSLSNILKAGDTVLFQNDIPDNYL